MILDTIRQNIDGRQLPTSDKFAIKYFYLSGRLNKACTDHVKECQCRHFHACSVYQARTSVAPVCKHSGECAYVYLTSAVLKRRICNVPTSQSIPKRSVAAMDLPFLSKEAHFHHSFVSLAESFAASRASCENPLCAIANRLSPSRIS